MKRSNVRRPFKVMGKGGRLRNSESKVKLVPTLDPPKWGARLPVAEPDDPELAHAMTRQQALEMFEPLPLPFFWKVYAEAPIGEVAFRIAGQGRILRAARLLQELGLASLAQRRTEGGTEYLIRRTVG